MDNVAAVRLNEQWDTAQFAIFPAVHIMRNSAPLDIIVLFE